MSGPLLEIEGYYFTKLCVTANEDFSQAKAGKKTNMSMSLGLGEDAGEDGVYQVKLQVFGFRSDDGKVPYEIDVEVVGRFKCKSEFKDDDRDVLVLKNAAAILFGAAREQVLTVTGRGPHGSMKLPTVSMEEPARNILKRREEERKDESSKQDI